MNLKAIKRKIEEDDIKSRHIKMFLLSVFTAFCFVTVVICVLAAVVNWFRS